MTLSEEHYTKFNEIIKYLNDKKYEDIEKDKICDYIKNIEAGASDKILYLFGINNFKYLLIDFSLSDESAEHFYNLTINCPNELFYFPKVYYFKDNYVITEYVNNSLTLDIFFNQTVKYKLVSDILYKCVDWIIEFKNYKFNDEILLKLSSVSNNKKISMNNLKELINLSNDSKNLNNYEKEINNLLDMLYDDKKIKLCHNDFHIGNIMIDLNNDLKIIDYHDCGYNTEHYDIVALLFHPKKYLSKNTKENLLKYYFEKSQLKNNLEENYDEFKINIYKTAFLRLTRSLLLRFKNLKNNIDNLKFILEIRRGLLELESLESYVNIHISSNLYKMIPNNNLINVVLCAGKGTRMRSDLPKCAEKILNKPMIEYISDIINMSASEKNIYVVGYKKEIMIDIIKKCSPYNDIFVNQENQLGTGHAMIQTINELPDNKTVLVIMGDMPVLTFNSLLAILEYHSKSKAITTAITSELKVNNSSGKVLRNSDGSFNKIVDCSDIDKLYSKEDAIKIKMIKEVHTGMYVFDSTYLKKYLLKLNCSNSQNEYYLTDILELQKKDNLLVECFKISHACEPTGANTREELFAIEQNFSAM